MKWLYFIFFIFLFITQIQANPLLVAVLMVKNEEPSMEMTLQPLINAGIKDYLIYDTGSTDNTIQITRDLFEKNNISNCVIEQGEFIDFATSRNKAIELTEQYFPEAVFMLMLDAEWMLDNGQKLLDFCLEQKDSNDLVYFISMKLCNALCKHPRLIRLKSNIKFVGKVHETPNVVSSSMVDQSVCFHVKFTEYGIEKSKQRWLRDADILKQDVDQNPNNSRSVYYLGQTYFCLKNWQEAAQWFEKRAVMSGVEEETFLAWYYLAFCYKMMGCIEKMIQAYKIAFCIRSCRAEPLIRLADYYYSIKQYFKAYQYIRHACLMPYPTQELFLEDQLYRYSRFALFANIVFCCSDYQLAYQVALKALEIDPDSQDFAKILSWYQE